MPLSFAFEELGSYSYLDLIHLGYVHSSPDLQQNKYQEYLLNFVVGLLIFANDGGTDQSVTTPSQYHHRCPRCVLLLLAVYVFYLFYFRLLLNF